jgi:NADH:ubiquinone oxidoreductase subunit 5 (subunit L)/multisubunit Na+/H+ antiporter MnhA subunit
MPEALVALVPLLPWLAGAWIAVTWMSGRNRGEAGERPTGRVASFAALVSLLLLLVLDLQALLRGQAPGQLVLGQWLASGEHQVSISFTLDGFALVVATLVAFICLLVTRFSVNYLHREAGFQRFFMILMLFTGAMLLIVLAGNAALAFVGWELAGVSSYLLIAYVYERPNATRNATRAFLSNRIGDAGFILGLFLCLQLLGTLEWDALAQGAGELDQLSAALLAIGFLVAAFAKSAQVPFAPWIARALEGPTPSSAVFYGALMVHAGVYLVIRLEPVLVQSPVVLALLVFIGALTALYGFLGGLVQTVVKSVLMFSTSAQVGLMFLACGLGWFELAAWHLVLHAGWRIYQFLHAPSLMHLMHRPTRPVPRWLRNRRRLHTAALQRFWLDHLADWLLVRPTQALARDIRAFDEHVVNRMVGLPASISLVSSLAQWEQRKQRDGGVLDGDTGDVGRARGAAGKLMEWIAGGLQWFEERLVLRGGEQGLQALLQRVGTYLMEVERLLSHPRYLLLFILATFIVII